MFLISEKKILLTSCLIIFFSTKFCYGQNYCSDIKYNNSQSKFSKNNITLAMFNTENEDSSKLSYNHRMSLYEKEKKSKVMGYILNSTFMMLSLGHYYAGEPQRAMRWHITYATGLGCTALAIKTHSENLLYLSVAILSFAMVYSYIDVGRTVEYHNMKLRKKYDLVLNMENINNNGVGLSLSFNF